MSEPGGGVGTRCPPWAARAAYSMKIGGALPPAPPSGVGVMTPGGVDGRASIGGWPGGSGRRPWTGG
jgi:hypothetical protein